MDDKKVLDRPSKAFVFNRLEVASSQTSINKEKKNRGQSLRSSVFNRLRVHTSQTSAFDCLSVAKNRASLFDHLKSDYVETSLKESIHTRKDKKLKESSQKKRLRDSMIDEFKKIQSVIPSWMKRQSNWVVIASETLKGK